jgi:hypothetical protein
MTGIRMNNLRIVESGSGRSGLRVFPGDDPGARIASDKLSNKARWSVNGFPATVEVWSPRAWLRLEHKPGDAQVLADGSRVVLRFD